MWADPIEMAALRGENQKEADRLKITLEEHLHNQYLKQTGKVEPTPPPTRYVNDWTGEVSYEPYDRRPKKSNFIVRFFKWMWRID